MGAPKDVVCPNPPKVVVGLFCVAGCPNDKVDEPNPPKPVLGAVVPDVAAGAPNPPNDPVAAGAVVVPKPPVAGVAVAAPNPNDGVAAGAPNAGVDCAGLAPNAFAPVLPNDEPNPLAGAVVVPNPPAGAVVEPNPLAGVVAPKPLTGAAVAPNPLDGVVVAPNAGAVVEPNPLAVVVVAPNPLAGAAAAPNPPVDAAGVEEPNPPNPPPDVAVENILEREIINFYASRAVLFKIQTHALLICAIYRSLVHTAPIKETNYYKPNYFKTDSARIRSELSSRGQRNDRFSSVIDLFSFMCLGKNHQG